MRPLRAILAVLVLAACGIPALAAGPDAGPSPSTWRERSAGFLVARPALSAVSDNAGTLKAEAVLKPGSGILYDRLAVPAEGIGSLDLSVLSDGCNLKSRDYEAGDARFPVSVTLVFGRDRQPLGWGARISRYLGRAWEGEGALGIRLTYAFACNAPTGSMYRLSEEETVFVVAGAEEAGKRIDAKRRPAEDFKAAYGRPPAGPVTGVFVRFDRPSGEKGERKTALDLKTGP